MQGLDPVMDGILEKMQEVTDNSNLRSLQQQASNNQETSDNADSGSLTSGFSFSDDKETQIQKVLENTLRRIDQSRDTYFDDLQAKDAAIKATLQATKAGETAKALGGGKYHQHTVHHHHHTISGTHTFSSSTLTPKGPVITNVSTDSEEKKPNLFGVKVIKETQIASTGSPVVV